MVRVLANVLNLPHAQHEGERRPLAQRRASPFFLTVKWLQSDAAGKRSDIVFRKTNRCLSFSGGLASRFIRKQFAHHICNLFDLLRCWRGRRWFG
jgi:hypothetical protein